MKYKFLSLFIAFIFIKFNSVISQQIRVACIGNSITAGLYPSKLQNELGENYCVLNCGVGARTMLMKGDFPYMNGDKFQQSKDFQPNIVIIALGTNDSKPHNWKHGDEFESNLVTMINAYKSLPTNPAIFLCRPFPAFEIRYGINNLVLQKEIYPIIKKVIKKNRYRMIDLYTPLLNDEHLFPDKIHPNEQGAEKIAKIIYNQLKYLKYTKNQ